jgi:hypothetical protein
MDHCLFDTAEKLFGTKFVKGALFCVTSCRFGISDVEIVDVLSQDKDIMGEVNKYWPSSRISMHVWMKFKAFFDELFMEQRSLCCWNSRQMRRVAEHRYSTRSASDSGMFFKLHRILGLYFGWGLAHASRERDIEALKETAKLPAVHGQPSDVAIWFPDQARLLNVRRFQECSYHLLLAASCVDDVAVAFKLYNLAYDEIFGMTPILCSCILGLGGDLLARMEDFKSAKRSEFFAKLPQAMQDRATQYFLFFSSNFQSISLHPRRELIAIATETFTKDGVSHVRDDAFSVVRGADFKRLSTEHVGACTPTQRHSFSLSSFVRLSRLFSPPMAEAMLWPSTLPEAMVSAITTSPCSKYVVCLCGASAESTGGGQQQSASQHSVFNIWRCRAPEPQFSVMTLEIASVDVHLSKRIALFCADQQPPVLACAVGLKVRFHLPR